MKSSYVPEITDAEFNEQVLLSKQPVLVTFLAGWSPACERFEPTLDEIAKACEHTAKVCKVNVDDNPDLGSAYAIQSIPTLMIFCDGVVRVKIVGTVSARAALAKLASLAQKTNPAQQHSEQP